MKKLIKIFALILVISSVMGVTCFADGLDYVVYEDQQAVLPKVYEYVTTITGVSSQTNRSFAAPNDVFIDKDNFIYIADSGNDRILKLDSSGALLLEISTFEDDYLINPTSVYVDESGRIFVTDTGNYRILVFDKDGTFSYYETCGNPVGDSDMYETYSYDKEKQVITVHSSDDSLEDMEIDVLRYVKDSLLVRINGSIKEFERNNDVPTPVSDVHDKLEGYSTYLALRNIENGMIETAPAYVDMDAGGRKFIREEKLADTVEIFNLYEKIVHPDGEKPDELTTEFSELTMEDVAYAEDNSFSAGYVWYNDDLEIIKIVYYGSMEIWE